MAAATALACGSAGGQTTSVEVGYTVNYRLYAHCGVRAAEVDGITFFAQPALDDGSSNPPPGWGNPYDDGTLTLVDRHTAVFRDPAGHMARFTDRPTGPTPSPPVCS